MNKNNKEVMDIVNQFDLKKLEQPFEGAKEWELCENTHSGIEHMLYYVVKQALDKGILFNQRGL